MLKAIPILFVLALAAGTTSDARAVPLAAGAMEGGPSQATQVHWRGHHHHGRSHHGHWHGHHHHGSRNHHWHRHHHHGSRHHSGWHRHHHYR